MTREEYIETCLKRPDSFIYYGDLENPPWGWTHVSHHRDSDLLDESNWETISKDLLERFPDSFVIERSNHFLVGWCEQLRVNTEDLEAIDALLEWQESLDNYPVADDEDYSQHEHEAALEAWDDYLAGDLCKELAEESPELFIDGEWYNDFVFGEVDWNGDFWDQVEYDSGGHYFITGGKNYIKSVLRERYATWLVEDTKRRYDEEHANDVPLPF